MRLGTWQELLPSAPTCPSRRGENHWDGKGRIGTSSLVLRCFESARAIQNVLCRNLHGALKGSESSALPVANLQGQPASESPGRGSDHKAEAAKGLGAAPTPTPKSSGLSPHGVHRDWRLGASCGCQGVLSTAARDAGMLMGKMPIVSA